MNLVLAASPALILLLAGAVVCALLCGLAGRRGSLWALLCCSCTVGLILAGLTAGAGLDELTAALLAVAAAALGAMELGGRKP